jgi:hypothetical protein
MVDDNQSSAGINRRDFIISLAASALTLVSGCATFRRESEVDAAFADLKVLLKTAKGDDLEGIVSIAELMKSESRALLDTHETFLVQFNESATDRTVTSDDLNKLVDDYLAQRKSQRDNLLHLQDELHAALPPEIWPEVLDVLNRKAQAIVAGTA